MHSKGWLSAIVGMLVPLDLLNSLALRCNQPSPELGIINLFKIFCSRSYKGVTVTSAAGSGKVIAADIRASNGVVHVIDSVI